MSKIVWDATGEHKYETGIDHGLMQFKRMFLAQKKRITLKALLVANHDITRIQFSDEIRILPTFDLFDSIAN